MTSRVCRTTEVREDQRHEPATPSPVRYRVRCSGESWEYTHLLDAMAGASSLVGRGFWPVYLDDLERDIRWTAGKMR